MTYLPTSNGEGYVFTRVCHSVHIWGDGCLLPGGGGVSGLRGVILV